METGTENMTTQALDTFVTKRRSTSKNARKTPPKTPEKQQKGRLFRKKHKKCRRILANRILLSNFANSKKTPLSGCRGIAPRRPYRRAYAIRPYWLATEIKQNILLYIYASLSLPNGGVKSLPKTIENSNCAHASPSEPGRRSMRAVFIRAYLYIY